MAYSTFKNTARSPLKRSTTPMSRGSGFKKKSKPRKQLNRVTSRALWNSFIANVNRAIFELLEINYCEAPNCAAPHENQFCLTTAHSRRRIDIRIGDFYFAFRCIQAHSDPCHLAIDATKRDVTEKIIEGIIQARNVSEAVWAQAVLKAVEIVKEKDLEWNKPRFQHFEVTAENLTPDSFRERNT